MLKRVFKAFSYPDFRLMWIGACTSSIGTWMQILAQSWLVYNLSHSSVYLGLDVFCGQVPIFLFSLFGGVFADRRSRRTLLLMSQYGQMTCAFILTALVYTNTVRVWHILCLSFGVGLVQSFGGPAYSALIPTLVPKEHLSNAIALNSIQFNLARVLGPMLGGIALSKLGATWCFGLNGISYIAVIITLYMIKVKFVPVHADASVMESMREGIDFIRKREGMMSLVALAFLMMFLSYPLLTFLPVVARDVFHGGSDIFTLFLCLSGAGSVTGALIVAGIKSTTGLSRRALIVMTLLGLFITGFGLSHNLGLSSLLIFCSGAALMVFFTSNTSLVQLYVGDQMRGRVMSVYNVAFRGGMPFGSLISGLLIRVTSEPAIMTANGVLVVVLGLYYLLIQRRLAKL
ncbi:MAG TPA: MFS transporter [Bryobacteraceae bacterium]|nr:MFS transporter [Bryobacteraceae bacterium]